MDIREILLDGYHAIYSQGRLLNLGTKESYGLETLHLTLGDGWSDLAVSVTFNNKVSVEVVPDQNNMVKVPPEATLLATPRCRYATIVFKGTKDGVQLISANLPYYVEDHDTIDGINSVDPTPDKYAQFVAEIKEDAERAEAAAEKAELFYQPEMIGDAVSEYISSADFDFIEEVLQRIKTELPATLKYCGTLPSGSSVGDIKDNSVYYLASANTYLDMPPDELTSGWVITFYVDNESAHPQWQLFFAKVNGSGMYTRRFSGGAWSAWNKFATVEDLRVAIRKSLKILAIGNSFNQDAMAYLPPVLQEMMPDLDITVATCYAGSASLQQHVDWFNEGATYTAYNEWEAGATAWKRYTDTSAKHLAEVIARHDWDIITIQGTSGAVISDDLINSDILTPARQLLRILQTNAVKPFALMWFQWMGRATTDYTATEMFGHISRATKKMMNQFGIQDYIPVGAAFHSALTVDSLAALGEGGGMLYSDNRHLNAGIPALLATYTTALKIAEWTGRKSTGIYSLKFTPDYQTVATLNVKDMMHGSPSGVNDTNMHLIQEIAVNALKHPDVITDWANGAPSTTGGSVSVEDVDEALDAYFKENPPFSGDYEDLRNAPEIPSVEGLASIEYVNSSINAESAKRKRAIEELEAKMNQQTLNFAEGSTMEEALAWLENNGDPNKLYIMPNNYFYHYVEKAVEGGTTPNFTNVLETATLSLNKRFNSSDELRDANGIVAIDYVAVKADDIIRFNKASVLNGSDTGYQRVKYYNSSKSSVYANDVQAHKALKISVDADGVASYVVGYINNTSSNDATNAKLSNASSIAYTRLNLYIGSAAITEADIADLVMTINEPIEYVTASGGTEFVWESTGHSFIPTDYEDRIEALEEAVENLEGGTNTVGLARAAVYAPSPQLPADGSDTADFNAETITCQNIYDYIDALASKYPKFLTKETLGKDQSGEFDWNRYTCCRRYYEAWQKENYPKMYGWTNGMTTIYSVSVSPRIGDSLYTTPYIGTAKGTVTAVSNAKQTRTVGGVVYTRNKEKDVEPTLVYSAMMTCKVGNSVYNSSKTKVTTISSIDSTTLVGADGITYMRYPLGDRNANFVKPKVIVIGSNEHGRPLDPAEPAIITARMIKDLCECVNANNPFLNTLKNEYMVVFLPIINPWGYDNAHKSYYNSRGVNLDRNLDTPGWGNDTSNPQGDYGGSEAEMQYFMNTLVESGAKIVTANHALGTQTNASGEGANSGRCHYMLGRNNSKYDQDLLSIAETMLANYNLFFTDYGQAPPESYAKTRSYIDWIGAEGGAVEMQAREGYVLDGTSQLHTARILEADYTLLLQFLEMLIANQTQ